MPRKALTQAQYEERLASMQGGRRCSTCHWYLMINEEQRDRYVGADGWCRLTSPFKMDFHRQYQGINDPQKTWCSFWEPDLVAIAMGE